MFQRRKSPLSLTVCQHITYITKLHFSLLWFFFERKKKKTIVRDKMIPGHMDKDYENLSYYRVFKN